MLVDALPGAVADAGSIPAASIPAIAAQLQHLPQASPTQATFVHRGPSFVALLDAWCDSQWSVILGGVRELGVPEGTCDGCEAGAIALDPPTGLEIDPGVLAAPGMLVVDAGVR